MVEGVTMDDLKGKKILVIDDDPYLRQLVTHTFSSSEAYLYTASDGSEGLRQFFDQQPDLVILDLMMPKLDGWAVCEQIRQMSSVPIIMLTALSSEEDIVRGLEAGAVDFITKPVRPKVLVARARAALRRIELPSGQDTTVYTDQHLTIDLGSYQVLVGDQPVKLTVTEFKLLAYLYQNADQVLTSEQILAHVWGNSSKDNTEYVHVYASNLRQKLEKDPKKPEYLLTVHGVGYRFKKQTDRPH